MLTPNAAAPILKNPCKHIAAVYYQLGDFFREDPFVLFQLRGRTKEQILEALRLRRQQAMAQLNEESNEGSNEKSDEASGESNETDSQAVNQASAQTNKKAASELAANAAAIAQDSPAAAGPAKQPVKIDSFWQYNQPLDSSLVVITPSEQTVLEVIGDMPLASTEAQAVSEYLKTLYQAVAQQAMMTALS